MPLFPHAARRATLFILLLFSALSLAGCGGGSGSDNTATGPQTPNTGGPADPTPTTPPPEPEPEPQPVNLTWDAPYDRAEEYPGTVDLPQQLITLRDGIRLSATVTLPAEETASRRTAPSRWSPPSPAITSFWAPSAPPTLTW